MDCMWIDLVFYGTRFCQQMSWLGSVSTSQKLSSTSRRSWTMDTGKKKEIGMGACGIFLYSLRREGDPMEFWVLSFWPYDKKKVVHFILMHGQDYRYTVTTKLKLLWNLSSDVHCSIHKIYVQLCHRVSLWMI